MDFESSMLAVFMVNILKTQKTSFIIYYIKLSISRTSSFSHEAELPNGMQLAMGEKFTYDPFFFAS